MTAALLGDEIRIAIPPRHPGDDHLEQVFQLLHPEKDELCRAANGTDLGLPLSRELVERNGGTLRLDR